MLQGITLCWARYRQDQLTDLFCAYFLLFLTVGEKTSLEKSLNLPPPPAFLKKKKSTDSLALQAQLCSLQQQSLSHQLSSAHHPSPLLLRSPGKNFLDRKEKGKKRSESLLFLIFPDPFIIFLYSEQRLTLPFHPPLLGISRGFLPCAPLQPQGAHYNSILIQSAIASNEGRSLGELHAWRNAHLLFMAAG